MSDLKVNCPHCNQSLDVPAELLGQTVDCPSCQGQMSLPSPAPQVRPAILQQPSATAPPQQERVPTPTGLIAATWILCVCAVIPLIGILCSIAMLVCAIKLVRSKNSTGKTNGIIALVVWIITFIIGFIISFAAAIG